MSTIIITGANGFIGSELVNYFHKKGDKVITFSRKKSNKFPEDVEFCEYDLLQAPNEEPFSRADYIIHTAFQIYSNEVKNSSEINFAGTKRLLELSEKYGLKKFVYFSTFSAHAGARSQYGLSKLEIEKLFDPARHLVLKPGLVLGNGGLFFALRNLIASKKIIPVFAGGQQPVQTIDVADIVKIIDIAFTKNISGIFPLGHPQVLSMKDINIAIAGMSGKKIKFFSIPYALGFFMLSIADLLHIKLPISKENLRGLKYGISYDTSTLKDIFNFELRNCSQSFESLKK